MVLYYKLYDYDYNLCCKDGSPRSRSWSRSDFSVIDLEQFSWKAVITARTATFAFIIQNYIIKII